MKVLFLTLGFVAQVVSVTFFGQPAPAAEGMSLKMAMVLWRGETSAEKGLKDGLKALGYSVEYVVYDAEQNKQELAAILREKIDPNVRDFDYVYCFGTTVTKMAKSILTDKVPILFNGVNAPVEAELVNSMELPGGNISGVSVMIPVEMQIERCRKLIPFKKLGVMYNAREKNATLRAEDVSKVSGKLNFEFVELAVSPEGNQLEKTVEKIVDRQIVVDAVFLPSDSLLISQAGPITEKLLQAKIPSIAAQKDSVISGATVGFVPDYYELGKMAAAIVDQNQKGKKLGEIPVGSARDPKLVINKKSCESLGIEIPKELMDGAR